MTITFRNLLLVFGCAAVALAGPKKIANDLAGADPGSTVQTIVQFQNQPGAAENALLTQLTPPPGSKWAYEGLPAVWGTLVFNPSGTSAGWGASFPAAGER
jgi:hypothetical protein